MGTLQQMQTADQMIRAIVAELRESGVHPCSIASVLAAHAGGLWRESIPNEQDRRKVIMHAAEVATTGQCQPIP